MSEKNRKAKKFIQYWPEVYSVAESMEKYILKRPLLEWLIAPAWSCVDASLILTGFLPLVDDVSEDDIREPEREQSQKISVSNGADLVHTRRLYFKLMKSSEFESKQPSDYLDWATKSRFYRDMCMPHDHQLLIDGINIDIVNTINPAVDMTNYRREYGILSSFSGPTSSVPSSSGAIDLYQAFYNDRYVSLIDYLVYLSKWYLGEYEKEISEKEKEKITRKIMDKIINSTNLSFNKPMLFDSVNARLEGRGLPRMHSVNSKQFSKLWSENVPRERVINHCPSNKARSEWATEVDKKAP